MSQSARDDGERRPLSDQAEAAACDESWAALGHLLSVATPPLDEARLVAKVRRRIAKHAERRWRNRLALAASLLLVCGVGWLALRDSPSGPTAGVSAVAEKPAAKIEQPIEPPLVVTSEHPAPARVVDPQWTDELAAEIELARQNLWNVERDWQAGNDAMNDFREQLDQSQRELFEAPL